MSRITLFGMYNYDNTLFDDIILPDGIDKDMLVNKIIAQSGDLYPYYQVPYILKQNITYWFIRRKYDFEQMHTALTETYIPIENYNRYEDITRNKKHSGTDTTDDKQVYTSEHYVENTLTTSGTDKTTREYNNEGTSNDTTTLGTTVNITTDATSQSENTNNVSAYNSSDYVPREQQTSTDTNNQTNTTVNSGTDTASNVTTSTSTDNSTIAYGSSNKTVTTDDNDSTTTNTNTITYGQNQDETETTHVHGNIGVTTNQQMIEAELNMRMKFDLYTMIAQLFEHEFIVQVY